ncbi:hypothetical protein PG999_014158 [Apiospora kogelbergensis]|uniref:Uncharacterized protein n=1 Tax=Apiospora kogelbergensis TaxID=1337665 RepID=A0AAW0Q695_9PEZI
MRPTDEFLDSSDTGPEDHAGNMKWFPSNRQSILHRYRQLVPHLLTASATSCVWAAALLLMARVPSLQPCNGDAALVAHNSMSLMPESGSPNFLSSVVETLSCGSSLEEAKALGCGYDILMNAWLSPPCLDAVSVADYQKDGSWVGYADTNRTIPIPLAELGDYVEYYTSQRDHVVHCLALWKRQFRALFEGWKYVDPGLTMEKHVGHCVKLLLEKTETPGDREIPLKVIPFQLSCHVRNVPA